MPRSFSTPADPRQPHLWRLLCFGFWNAHTIAACFFNIDEAVSSFRECGLPYGLRDSLCTLQPFRSALTPPPHGCNTRYEWLVRPYSTGTFTQLETPSFAWRTRVQTSVCCVPGRLLKKRFPFLGRTGLSTKGHKTTRTKSSFRAASSYFVDRS